MFVHHAFGTKSITVKNGVAIDTDISADMCAALG